MPPSPSRKITQKDVAKAAGVSQALVSLVLGGDASADVSPESRARVLEAAKRIGYRQRRRNAGGGMRQCLAYIYPVVQRPKAWSGQHEWLFKSYDDFYARIQMALDEAARKRGFALMAYPASSERELTQWLSEWDIRGVFWNDEDVNLAKWIERRLPIVQVDRRMLDSSDAVMTNQVEMTTKAMSYLYEKGHRRILFHSKWPLDCFLSRERLRGYREFIEAAGLPDFNLATTFPTGDRSKYVLEERVIETLRLPEGQRPTAAVLPDLYALRLQKILLSQGYTLPDDLSIVGIDNVAACDYVHPALTSIDGEHTEVALNAIDLMEARLSEPDRPARKIEVSPRLIERESVMALPLPDTATATVKVSS